MIWFIRLAGWLYHAFLCVIYHQSINKCVWKHYRIKSVCLSIHLLLWVLKLNNFSPIFFPYFTHMLVLSIFDFIEYGFFPMYGCKMASCQLLVKCVLIDRASMFMKFCKRLQEFQESKRFRLHAITVLNCFHCRRSVKSLIFFLKKSSLKNVPCANIQNCLVRCCDRTH